MAKPRVKPIHLTVQCGYRCKAACDYYCIVIPIESTIIRGNHNTNNYSKGTFDPTKVTCKRCLKHSDYKIAMDRIKYPLFFLKENN